MPIYEYRCRNGHQFEVFQAIADPPVTACQECGAPVERVFHPIAVHFKGTGFYTTDYARKGAKAESTDGDSPKTDSKDSSSKDSGSKESSSEAKKPSKSD